MCICAGFNMYVCAFVRGLTCTRLNMRLRIQQLNTRIRACVSIDMLESMDLRMCVCNAPSKLCDMEQKGSGVRAVTITSLACTRGHDHVSRVYARSRSRLSRVRAVPITSLRTATINSFQRGLVAHVQLCRGLRRLCAGAARTVARAYVGNEARCL
jgi:hypothetical protein